MPSFEDLPFELVSEILSIAAELSLNDPETVTYSYGLTQAPRLMQNKTSVQKYVRGRLPTDVLRWNSVNTIRQVNRRWHHWALSHSLKELYIRRWQGGETWMRRAFESVATVDHVPVVYQDPYNSVRRTAKLLNDYPTLAQHVRKVWFNGIYRFDTVPHIFNILRNCVNIRTVTLPWTALRYADKESWDNLLSFPRLTSLEFLAVGLKQQVCSLEGSQKETNVLERGLDFSKIRRLKIFGDSNFKPITDDDLMLMAQTATNLQEILITNVSTITAKGVAALVRASCNSLKLLEFIPLVNSGFEPPRNTEEPFDVHFCDIIVSCPRLVDIAVTLPTVCTHFFSNPRLGWRETVRVRVAGIGAISGRQDSPVDNLRELLDTAREFMEKKKQVNSDLAVEIAIGCYLFDIAGQRVHGNYGVAKLMSQMQWTPAEEASVKGPYGYTGLYGVGMKGEWSCITENEFLEAVGHGLISLN